MTVILGMDGRRRDTLCDLDAEIIKRRIRKLILIADACPRVASLKAVVNRATHDYIEDRPYRGRRAVFGALP